ncbi:HAMP domain-containing sensor histidine kinase [Arthrobacter sp. SDTb3-6]|uniref:sensor histidine kinase n=1 Tax=Arthrobacter sp. SDTb3-6 TaxID=2713571 RepID=UPI00159E340A|nr:HAMP domain-containing sensor histidine kinase [Arthrobacter sp. SDTb3-6]NVM98475.1 HAMP domain-containing histidine kinase [Arthrobacter sp. SDTb3-6]
MRARLLLVLAILAAVTAAGFAVPLSLVTSESRTREFVLSRDADVQRLAGLAEEYVTTGKAGTLPAEMEAYTALYGEPLLVTSTLGIKPLSTGLASNALGVRESLARAIRNQPAPVPAALTPWSPPTVLFAQPIGSDVQVSGAIILAASTEGARADIERAWLLALAAVAAALLIFGVIAHAVSRWVLRPLGRLRLRVRELAAGLPFIPVRPGRPQPSPRAGGPPELRELAGSFDAMASAVTASTAAQQRLVADTAHQLRNPLAALQLRLDTLEGQVDAANRPRVQRAGAEAERLNAILRDLLALARAETPRPPVNESCDAWSMAAERVNFWSVAALEAGTPLTLVKSDTTHRVLAQEHLVQQLLDVLLDNACKYAPGEKVVVSVTAGRRNTVVVTVADSGPGVPASDLGRLSERFFRGGISADRGASNPPGTGLGLAIGTALAENMGGTLHLSPTPGGGLTAAVELPGLPNPANPESVQEGSVS